MARSSPTTRAWTSRARWSTSTPSPQPTTSIRRGATPARRRGQGAQRGTTGVVVAGAPQLGERRLLLLLDLLGDDQDRDLELLVGLDVLVDPDDDALLALHLALVLVGGAPDLALEEALLDARDHPAHRLDVAEIVLGLLPEPVREALDVIGAGERIDGLGHADLVGDDLLGAQRQLDRLVARQRDGLVHRVGVERLGAAQHRSQPLVGGAHDVVLGLLVPQRAARSLDVEAIQPRPHALTLVALA